MANTFKRSVVAINIASLLFYNVMGVAATTASPQSLEKKKVHSAKIEAAAKAWLAIQEKRKQMLQDSAAAPVSNAFNFQSLYGSKVDERTGGLSFHFTVGALTGNNGLGPNLKLMVQYSQNNHTNPYGLGQGWSFNLPHYDPKSQTFTFESGASFRITDIDGTGLKNLQYQKLKVAKVYRGGKDDSFYLKTVSKKGQINYFDSSGYITRMQSVRGDQLHFFYDTSTGGHILTAIKDDNGKQLRFKSVGGGYNIISQDDQGQDVVTQLSIRNELLTQITLPVINQSITFHYTVRGNQRLMDEVHYPTGAWDSFEYTQLTGPEISGHPAFYSYAVSQHISHPNPGTSPDDQKTTYDYNVVSGHNYLGHGANVPYSTTEDLLFSAPQSYQYGTTVNDGKSKVTTMYNKFHLETEQTIKTITDKVLQRTEQCYELGLANQVVCGDQAVSVKIGDVKASYTLPVQVNTAYYAPVSMQHKGLLASDGPRVITSKTTYDDEGNALTKTDPLGRKIINTYDATPNANGFVNDELSSTVIPANAGQPNAPSSVKVTYQYIKLNPQHPGPVAKLSLPKQVTSSYQTADKQWQAFRQRTNEYYGEQQAGKLSSGEADPNYTLVKAAKVQLITPKSDILKLGAAPVVTQQARQYQYHQDMSVTINGKTYPVVEQQTQTGSQSYDSNELLKADPTKSFTTYNSTYTHRTLLQVDAMGHKTAFQYDGLGREISAVANYGEANQATKTFTYKVGPNNNVMITTLPSGYQTKVVMDGAGRETARYMEHIGADGKAVSNKWDQVLAKQYDSNGNVVQVTHYDTDGTGKEIVMNTYSQYDAQHRLTVLSNPNGTAQVTYYDDNAVAPDGSQVSRVITYGLVSNGKAVPSHGSPPPCRVGDTFYGATLSGFTVVDYNAKHQALYEYVFYGDPASYSGDLQSGLAHNITFLGKGMVLDPSWLPGWIAKAIQSKAYHTVSSQTYDGVGRPLTQTDVDGNVTRNVYDENSRTGYRSPGHLIETISPGGHTKIFHYGISSVDQISALLNGKETSLGKRGFDGEGHLLWQADPLGDTSRYEYNQNGNVIKVTTPNGDVIDQEYNSMNKIIKRSVEGDAAGLYTTTWAYNDKTGLVSQRVDATGTTKFQYNQQGLLTSIIHTTEGAQPTQAQPAYQVSFGYTRLGQMAWVQDASGEKATYHYVDQGPNIGRLDTVSVNGQVIHYQYDDANNQNTLVYPNGMQTVYTYDKVSGRLVSLLYEQTAPTKKVITAFTYAYYPDGNIKTRTRTDGTGQKAEETYTYDKDNNLLTYKCDGGLCPKDQKQNTILSQSYTFDGVNNINTVESQLQTGQGKTLTNTTTYHYSDELPTRLMNYQNSSSVYGAGATLSYDSDGNITQDGQNQLLSYDPLDRMVSLTQAGEKTPKVNYVYNGDNVQVGVLPTGKPATYYIYGQGRLLNSQQGKVFTGYLYGTKRLAQIDKGVLTYYLTDQSSSVVNMVGSKDNQPQVLSSYAYSPYGIESALQKPGDTTPAKLFGFDGQLTDTDSGWQFLGQGYRAYNPLIKRFMSHDSESPFGGGGLNGYNFASNNPIANYDPTGHVSSSIILGSIGVGLAAIFGTIFTFGAATPAFTMAFVGDALAIGASYAGAATGAASLILGQSHDVAKREMADKLGLASFILGLAAGAVGGLGNAWTSYKVVSPAAKALGELDTELGSIWAVDGAEGTGESAVVSNGETQELEASGKSQVAKSAEQSEGGSSSRNTAVVSEEPTAGAATAEAKLAPGQKGYSIERLFRNDLPENNTLSVEKLGEFRAKAANLGVTGKGENVGELMTFKGQWQRLVGAPRGARIGLSIGSAVVLSGAATFGGIYGAVHPAPTHVDPLPPPPPPPPAPAPSGVNQGGGANGSAPMVMTTNTLPPLPSLDGGAIRS